MKYAISWRSFWRVALWSAVIASIAWLMVTDKAAHAEVAVTLGWDQYAAPGDFDHAALMQSEQNPDGTWTPYHEIARPNVADLVVVVPGLPDGMYRWQLWAVDTSGDVGVGDTVLKYLEDTSGPPPPIPNFRFITTTIVEIRGGQIVAQNTTSNIVPVPAGE